MSKYPVKAELKKFCFKIPFSRAVIALSRLPLKIMWALCRDRQVKVTRIKQNGEIPAADVFKMKGLKGVTPVIYFIHGGGFGFAAAPHHKRMAFTLAKAGYTVVMPRYALLPSGKYPKARREVFELYKNYCGKAVVLGDSAGGTLAAQLVKDAESGNVAPPLGVMLLYPVTDASCSTESMKKYTDTPLWNSRNNKKMWKMLGAGDISEACPMTEELPAHIPPFYIETAEFDCLRDEGKAYAKRLKANGADVELHETAGTVHGYDIAHRSKLVRDLFKMRLEFIEKVIKNG